MPETIERFLKVDEITTELLLMFLSYLARSKSVSALRPGYDDKYRSRSHRFVERQKLISTYRKSRYRVGWGGLKAPIDKISSHRYYWAPQEESHLGRG